MWRFSLGFNTTEKVKNHWPRITSILCTGLLTPLCWRGWVFMRQGSMCSSCWPLCHLCTGFVCPTPRPSTRFVFRYVFVREKTFTTTPSFVLFVWLYSGECNMEFCMLFLPMRVNGWLKVYSCKSYKSAPSCYKPVYHVTLNIKKMSKYNSLSLYIHPYINLV